MRLKIKKRKMKKSLLQCQRILFFFGLLTMDDGFDDFPLVVRQVTEIRYGVHRSLSVQRTKCDMLRGRRLPKLTNAA